MSQTPEASARDLGLIAVYGDCSPLRGPNGPVNKTIDALSAANLLHDPEEVARGKEALAACVAVAEAHASWRLPCDHEQDGAVSRAVRIGRAELERRKPKPRWTVGATLGGAPTILCGMSIYHVLPIGFEPEARAYVARKNAEEAK